MSERAAPWIRFYPADFMNGVRGMTAQEVGLYQMLLCRIYEENGPVEYNLLRLATYCGMREATFAKTFEKLVALGKLSVVDGMVMNARAAIEISNRANDLKNASKAGKASAEKRQQKQRQPSTDVQQPFNHTDTDTDKIKEEKEDANASSQKPPPPREDVASAADLVADLIHALGFARGQQIPKYWAAPDVCLIVSRWVCDLKLSSDEILQVARHSHVQHGTPANGPKVLIPAMQAYAAAKYAPPLEAVAAPSRLTRGASSSPTASEIMARIMAQDAAQETQ